jgi:hypothetical protein
MFLQHQFFCKLQTYNFFHFNRDLKIMRSSSKYHLKFVFGIFFICQIENISLNVYTYIWSTRNYCDREIFDIEISRNLKVASSPERENVVFGMSPFCVLISTSMCALPTPKLWMWMYCIYTYLMFKIVYIIGRCPTSINILAPKNRGPSDGPIKIAFFE